MSREMTLSESGDATAEYSNEATKKTGKKEKVEITPPPEDFYRTQTSVITEKILN